MENANNFHFYPFQLCCSSTNFDILGVKDSIFPILIANKIFCVTVFFYLFTFAISLWHRKFVTADVTAVFVNNQHSIQRRGPDFDKNTQISAAYLQKILIFNIPR